MSFLSLFRDPLNYRSVMMEQQFGTAFNADDLLEPRRTRRLALASPYQRHWISSTANKQPGSALCLDKHKFQMTLDVQQFQPEEIKVKTAGRSIIVEGKHEEKQDEHGLIFRHFVRKYVLPEGHDINLVRSSLSNDGVLTIIAPTSEENEVEKEVPVALTGRPSPTVPHADVEGDEDNKIVEARIVEEMKLDENKLKAKKLEEKKLEEKKLEEKRLEEKKLEEKKLEEKKLELRKLDEKKLEERLIEELKVDEKKAEAKKVLLKKK